MAIADKTTLLATCSRWLRHYSIKATSEAGSGHPTSCMSAADLTAAVFFEAMRFDVQNPGHPGNDRFVFSKGHAAPLLYAAWSLAGAFPKEKLLTLRKIDSDLEGHPTPRFPYAEVATGSLGQGLSIGLGMALSGKYLDRLDYRVYVLMGDGEAMEGAVWEAAALAAHYKLDNLIAIVDVNRLGQSQETSLGHDAEAYAKRFAAFGWRTRVINGHDFDEILPALAEAQTPRGQPTALIAKTFKGKGVSFIENKDNWHGKPLKKGEEMERALAELGDIPDDFHPPIPMKSPQSARPAQPRGETPVAPAYQQGEKVATREAYGAALAALGDADSRITALDGDTKNSTFSEVFLKRHPQRFFEGFIAEQNMVSAAAGLATRGKIPFASTFGAFFARAYDQIRMAAISRANIKLAGSHCGVSIGEDGPSQMALEDLAMMRAVPTATVFYPADAQAASQAVFEAAKLPGIVYIRTTRPKTPVIYQASERFPAGGAKVLKSSGQDTGVVVAAGITVYEALKAYEILKTEGLPVRIIDAYSIKPIDARTLKEAAKACRGRVLTVEDHYAEGGLGDAVLDALSGEAVTVHKLAVRGLPRSGAPEELLDAHGISSRHIVDFVRKNFK
ncbi:MAG: transketolase [Elusimicrobia bacterium]|nr:transketolase [Elusimicrobiota bacterium]